MTAPATCIPLATYPVGGKRMRFYRPPHDGVDFAWVSFSDAYRVAEYTDAGYRFWSAQWRTRWPHTAADLPNGTAIVTDGTVRALLAEWRESSTARAAQVEQEYGLTAARVFCRLTGLHGDELAAATRLAVLRNTLHFSEADSVH